jgi:hypothetical protein
VNVTYPFKGDHSRLNDNLYQVVGMATRYGRKLVRSGMIDNYNGVLQDYIDRKTLVPISGDEIRQHKEDGGFINYICHHGVEKDTSTTTPLRLVANSATKNWNTSPAVNDLWPKGQKSLSSLLRVMLRWRCYPVALVWDLSIYTSKREKFLILIVWRFGKSEEDWRTWGFGRVAFEDVPASVFLELVKELAGVLGVEINALTAKKVAEDGYMDDNLSGGTEEEVNEMIGETTMVEGKYWYSGFVSIILVLETETCVHLHLQWPLSIRVLLFNAILPFCRV